MRMNSLLKPPTHGNWHHGNGVVVCGTIRVFSVDFDTTPSEEVKTKWLDWVCDVLNRETENHDLFEDFGEDVYA